MIVSIRVTDGERKKGVIGVTVNLLMFIGWCILLFSSRSLNMSVHTVL